MILVLERLLEFNEQSLVKTNEIHNLYNVSVPTQVNLTAIEN